MATEVLQGFNDFVLFPQQRDISSNPQLSFVNSSFDHLYSEMASNFPQDFAGFGGFHDNSYQDAGVAPSYYSAPRSRRDDAIASTKAGTSTSPSISLSQSLEHIPSNFSAASGHSTASSAVGSPYSQQHGHPAGQDQWVEMGLGLAPAEMYPPGAYQLTSSEPERVAYDDKFASSFVGESPQIFQPVSSASPNVSSFISSSPISEPASAASSVTAMSPAVGGVPKIKHSMRSNSVINKDESSSDFIADPGNISATSIFQSSPLPAPQQRGNPQHNSSFFSQSSGNFVAPLQSSCWLSLKAPIPFQFLSLFDV